MNTIYIIFSQTGTTLSRIVKFYTKKKYNHCSISFDSKLNTMYSFGRLHPYNPFLGGFVIEGKNIGTFKRFKNTKCKVLSLKITNEQYALVNRNIEYFNSNKANFEFNVSGMLGSAFGKYRKTPNKFYCSEFVYHILTISNIDTSMLGDIPYPMIFEKLPNIQFFYEGYLRDL